MTTLLSPKPESTLPTQSVTAPVSQDQVDSATNYSALAPQDWPNIDHLVTEDDTPVDNIFSEKQQRLLVESLYTSWRGADPKRQFLALANVGLFCGINQPPLVPDALLSLEVKLFEDIWTKAHRSYLLWEYGKPPEVVIEIVSNRKGHELDSKLHDYARIGVAYYIVYDPEKQLSEKLLYLYERRHISYVEISGPWLPEVELGLTLWHGQYEDREDTWLRWCDPQGNLILTGAERAEQERQHAEQEYQRAEQEHQRADQESQRAEQEHQRAEQERQRAEQERQRAEQERQRAEQASQDKEQALLQLEQERQRVAQLLAQLQALESNNK
ncbi:MAG: Uma2 family endonuclease [Thioploca sp.]|nr:Uma2 family endonuclease [Thioploca sp.]